MPPDKCGLLFSSTDFFKINFLEQLFQEHYQSFKQFGNQFFTEVRPAMTIAVDLGHKATKQTEI